MGEKEESKKDGDGGPITVVLKLDLHCEGCAKKVKRSISHFEGVEKVKADHSSSKLTVHGNVDPTLIRERVEYKTKKKVEIISPLPKKEKDDGNDAKKKADDNKSDKKESEEKKGDENKPKEPMAIITSTVALKMKLHCDGCAHKIKRTILKNIDGVDSVKTELEKDLISVTGTMNVKELTAYLKEKAKRSIDILPPKKDGGAGGGDDKGKEKESKGEGGDKKDKVSSTAEGGGGGEGKKVEVNKMEHRSTFSPQTHYAPPPLFYNQSYYSQDYGVPLVHNHHYQGYGGGNNNGHVAQYYSNAGPPPPPPPTYLNDQMFSDENPNGCFVM